MLNTFNNFYKLKIEFIPKTRELNDISHCTSWKKILHLSTSTYLPHAFYRGTFVRKHMFGMLSLFVTEKNYK